MKTCFIKVKTIPSLCAINLTHAKTGSHKHDFQIYGNSTNQSQHKTTDTRTPMFTNNSYLKEKLPSFFLQDYCIIPELTKIRFHFS